MEEVIFCDVCSLVIEDVENKLFHITAVLDGKVNTDVHICLECYKEQRISTPVIKK